MLAVPEIFAFPATMFPLPEICIVPILIFADEAMEIFPMLAVWEIFAFAVVKTPVEGLYDKGLVVLSTFKGRLPVLFETNTG